MPGQIAWGPSICWEFNLWAIHSEVFRRIRLQGIARLNVHQGVHRMAHFDMQ
jgi:hypothetical protein